MYGQDHVATTCALADIGCSAVKVGKSACSSSDDVFVLKTPYDVEIASWDVLPPPIAAQVLDLVTADAQDAVVLLTLSREWYKNISANKRFQELFECHARVLMRTLAEKHFLATEVLDRHMPYQVNNFMRRWLEVQFPSSMSFTAWSSSTPPPFFGKTCLHESHSSEAKSVFIIVKQRLLHKDRVLQQALTLNRLTQWMNHDGVWHEKLNALIVLFLVPQGFFWLAVYVDMGLVWADVIGRACGLAACVGGMICTACATIGQARIIQLKMELRRQLVGHPKTCGLALLKDRSEALNLYRCSCWVFTIGIATWWLLLEAPADLVMLVTACLSSLLSVVAIAIWRFLAWRGDRFPMLFKLWFVHVWGLTLFFSALAIANLLSGWLRVSMVCLAAAGPIVVLCGDVAIVARWGCSKLQQVMHISVVVGVVLLLVLSLIVACGRSVNSLWADAVPLMVLASPLQLPILGCAIAVGCRGICSATFTCCRVIHHLREVFTRSPQPHQFHGGAHLRPDLEASHHGQHDLEPGMFSH
jgi:hypothetical protein